MRRSARRVAAVLAVPALSLTALTAMSAPASAAEPDRAPLTAATSWLTGQLTDGILHNDQYDFDDYGLSIDAGLALAAVDGQGATVDTISDAIAANIDAYTKPGFGTNLSAGGTAKAAVFARTAGEDPRSYGGADLVAALESTVATDGAIAGRIQDDWDPSDQFAADYANVLGQAYAAQALDAAGSTSTDAVTDFLLQQQCANGGFRLYFADADAPDQTCDGGEPGSTDPDTTAIAIMALASQADDVDVAAHIDAAATWLRSIQGTNGAFPGNQQGFNANSTGLAGWALGSLGDTESAAKAAAWVRGHELANVANCVYFAASDLGAIAYSDGVRTAAAAPIDDTTADQFRRATAQALPVLQWAPTGAGEPRIVFTSEYVRAGRHAGIAVFDLTPGEPVCAMLGEQSVIGWAKTDGFAKVRVLLPKGTGKNSIRLANGAGTIDTAVLNALGPKKLPMTLKGRVAAGSKQVVKIRGLAPAEFVLVYLNGKPVVSDQVRNKHTYTAKFKVTGKPGKATVKVFGQFGNRSNSKTFTVTR